MLLMADYYSMLESKTQTNIRFHFITAPKPYHRYSAIWASLQTIMLLTLNHSIWGVCSPQLVGAFDSSSNPSDFQMNINKTHKNRKIVETLWTEYEPRCVVLSDCKALGLVLPRTAKLARIWSTSEICYANYGGERKINVLWVLSVSDQQRVNSKVGKYWHILSWLLTFHALEGYCPPKWMHLMHF